MSDAAQLSAVTKQKSVAESALASCQHPQLQVALKNFHLKIPRFPKVSLFHLQLNGSYEPNSDYITGSIHLSADLCVQDKGTCVEP